MQEKKVFKFEKSGMKSKGAWTFVGFGTIALFAVFLRYLYDILRNDRNNVLKIALIAGIVIHNFTDFAIFWIQTVLLFIMALAYKEQNEQIRGYRQKRNK